MPSRCEICCELFIAILLPPLGVCLRHGCCSVSSSLSGLPVCFPRNWEMKFSRRRFDLDPLFFSFFFSQVEFWICVLLTILGYIPGIIYALYAIVFIDRDEYFNEYRRPLYAPAWSESCLAFFRFQRSSFYFIFLFQVKKFIVFRWINICLC